MIRDNLNLIILFPQNETNLKRIFDDHVGFEHFKPMCRICWTEQYDVLVINLERDSGKYTHNFNGILRLKP